MHGSGLSKTELAATQRSLEEVAATCGELEETISRDLASFELLQVQISPLSPLGSPLYLPSRDLASFELLQRAQAYAEDLLDCLGEKAPRIEAAEELLHTAGEDRYDGGHFGLVAR